ncbi:MAG: WcbI family polysaccharide biosynthesis putative acetyltransferase, partial [Rhodopila sp.]
MSGFGLSHRISGAQPRAYERAPQAPAHRALVTQFESLGGSGHGPEFAIFQQHYGGDPSGLLAWADLGTDLLVATLESRFEGVGSEENTIVFCPHHSDEWWTRDKRYWMAMRSFIRTDLVDIDQATAALCARSQTRRATLVADLQAGEKIFVFKNIQRNLTDAELDRLHGAIRAYGETTLFYVRYEDAAHPNGLVELVKPGLIIGYMDHFAFSPDNRPLGSSDAAWLALCERAAELHAKRPVEGVAWTGSATADPLATSEMRGFAEPRAMEQAVVDPEINEPVEVRPTEEPATPGPMERGSVRRGRHIVLIGNCQMQAMAGMYRRFVAGRSGDVVEHVLSYQDLSEESRQAIQHADLVVEQLFDLKPQVDTAAVSTSAPRLFIPMVTAAFLWPFAGSPHPKNTFHPFLTGGPYGGEASDSYLNRLILSGTDPEEAVETYANLDVNGRVKLDRLFEIVMDRQRARDEAAGYKIASIMEQHFRTEQIFLSPYHPNVRIATALASQFFEQLGAQRDEIDRMVVCTRITPFPKSELPFHPSVCRHFGLQFVTPDRRYRFMNEGLFTFREHALRYMRYEWNDALEEGMWLSQKNRLNEARERLTVAVQRSPRSAAGHNALGHVMVHQNERDAAISELRRAIEIEPEMASYRANLGALLRQARQLDEALIELRFAVAADPGDPHYRVLLAHVLRQRGQFDEAYEAIREALQLDPYSTSLHAELAGALEAKGDLEGAVVSLQDTIAIDPDDEATYVRLAQLLGRLDRLDDAIEAARKAVTLASESTRARLVLSDLLLRRGDPAEALSEAYVAAVTEPASAHAYGHLGYVLSLTGDLTAAEAAFRRAARLDPSNAHFRHEISAVLHRQDRYDEAIEAAREAAALQPGNPNRFVHLAGMLAQQGNLASAQA